MPNVMAALPNIGVPCVQRRNVALVRTSDASLKRAARGSLKTQDAKSRQNRHLGTIAQLCRAISSQLRHVSTIGKKTC